jgi:hypothetical protein
MNLGSIRYLRQPPDPLEKRQDRVSGRRSTVFSPTEVALAPPGGVFASA